MATINQLSPVSSVSGGDQIPVYNTSNGDARKMSINALTEYMDEQLLPNNATEVLYDPAGTNAVQTTVQAKLREVVSVKDFGAVGDGVKDDTAAIQSAITYAAIDGKVVHIPAGVYLVSAPLVLPPQGGGLAIQGEGNVGAFYLRTGTYYKGSVLIYTGTTGDVISATGGSLYAHRGVKISDLAIDSSSTSGWAISLTGTPDRTIVSNVVAYGPKGISLNDVWTNTKCVSCHVEGTGRGVAGTIGFSLRNETESGGLCAFENCTAKNFETGYSIGKQASGDQSTTSPSLVQCQAIEVVNGVNVRYVSALQIVGCHFENGTNSFVNFAGDGCQSADISGNYFYNCDGAHIKCNASASNVIQGLSITGGNTFSIIKSGGYGILLNDSSHVDACISGNYFSDYLNSTATHLGGFAIYSSVGTPTNVTIGANSFFMIDETKNVYPYGTEYGEAFSFNETLGYAEKKFSQLTSLTIASSQTLPIVAATAGFSLSLAEGTLFGISSGAPQNIARLTAARNGTTRASLDGTIVMFIAEDANSTFLHNSGSYSELRFKNKSGSSINLAAGQTITYVLKTIGGVQDWYEL
jgi:hypothetical protein